MAICVSVKKICVTPVLPACSPRTIIGSLCTRASVAWSPFICSSSSRGSFGKPQGGCKPQSKNEQMQHPVSPYPTALGHQNVDILYACFPFCRSFNGPLSSFIDLMAPGQALQWVGNGWSCLAELSFVLKQIERLSYTCQPSLRLLPSLRTLLVTALPSCLSFHTIVSFSLSFSSPFWSVWSV